MEALYMENKILTYILIQELIYIKLFKRKELDLHLLLFKFND